MSGCWAALWLYTFDNFTPNSAKANRLQGQGMPFATDLLAASLGPSCWVAGIPYPMASLKHPLITKLRSNTLLLNCGTRQLEKLFEGSALETGIRLTLVFRFC